MPRHKTAPTPQPVIHPDLEPYLIQLKAARKARKAATQLVDEAQSKLMGAIARHIGGIYSDALDLGTWECLKSPIGVCVYNGEEDPAHDSCLFCGDPEERK